jgi:hypothetical protein
MPRPSPTATLRLVLAADTASRVPADREPLQRAAHVLRTLTGPSVHMHVKCSFVERELLEPVAHGLWLHSFPRGISL